MFAWTLTLTLFVLPVSAQKPLDRIETLAATGRIQENAPVKASSRIAIHASPEKVWDLLTDVDNWPKWQSTITAAKINGPVAVGTTFTWNSGGTKIVSRIALVQPNTQLVWTGTAYKARAIHVWSLEPSPDGGTIVKTTESMDGFLLTVFYSSKDLAGSHKLWLDALKHKAEE